MNARLPSRLTGQYVDEAAPNTKSLSDDATNQTGFYSLRSLSFPFNTIRLVPNEY